MYYGENMSGEFVFPVRDCKAGRHKRSSSKATVGISGKCWGESIARKLLEHLVIVTGKYAGGMCMATVIDPAETKGQFLGG